jgi:hypothetical protein
MAQGLTDGLRVARGFQEGAAAPSQLAGAALPLLFTPERGALPGHLAGALRDGVEARLHRARHPRAEAPVCAVSAGYAAGWYSALLSDFYLVKETACLACGAPCCVFDARPAQHWVQAQETWASELLPCLDYPQLWSSAQKRVESAPLASGGLLGEFDSMSPAVHVWGPVMVLPYSGADDSEAAIDAIRADVGPGQIRVVVIDATGVRLDAVERSGLLRLVDAVEARDLEPVVAGLRCALQASPPRARDCLGMPLLAPDLTRAIALAFQLCHGHQV